MKAFAVRAIKSASCKQLFDSKQAWCSMGQAWLSASSHGFVYELPGERVLYLTDAVQVQGFVMTRRFAREHLAYVSRTPDATGQGEALYSSYRIAKRRKGN